MRAPRLQTRLDGFVAAACAFGYLLTLVCSFHLIAIVPRSKHICYYGELRLK